MQRLMIVLFSERGYVESLVKLSWCSRTLRLEYLKTFPNPRVRTVFIYLTYSHILGDSLPNLITMLLDDALLVDPGVLILTPGVTLQDGIDTPGVSWITHAEYNCLKRYRETRWSVLFTRPGVELNEHPGGYLSELFAYMKYSDYIAGPNVDHLFLMGNIMLTEEELVALIKLRGWDNYKPKVDKMEDIDSVTTYNAESENLFEDVEIEDFLGYADGCIIFDVGCDLLKIVECALSNKYMVINTNFIFHMWDVIVSALEHRDIYDIKYDKGKIIYVLQKYSHGNIELEYIRSTLGLNYLENNTVKNFIYLYIFGRRFDITDSKSFNSNIWSTIDRLQVGLLDPKCFMLLSSKIGFDNKYLEYERKMKKLRFNNYYEDIDDALTLNYFLTDRDFFRGIDEIRIRRYIEIRERKI